MNRTTECLTKVIQFKKPSVIPVNVGICCTFTQLHRIDLAEDIVLLYFSNEIKKI